MNQENNKISCHSELDFGSCCSNSVKGFTLLEIVITVIIIAVLATIAVSAYQRATLKSRFNSLMPTTKAIHDGQEAYYMGNGDYADSVGDLDVRTTDTADMSITLGSNTDEDLKYVFATRNPMNNHLIAYQKHSPKFSDHMHCEALKDDTLAQWLCEDALHGQHIDGSVSGADWDTYVIAGNVGPNDYFTKECEGNGEQECSCGSITGTCNDKTGNWEFDECPAQPPTSQTCTGGKRQLRSVTCGSNGWQTGAWSGCASEAAATAYEVIQEYDDFARRVRAAQEAYYQQHGKYATDIRTLGVAIPSECSPWKSWQGNSFICGKDIYIDNGLKTEDHAVGYLMVEYCPGHNNGYYDCASVRSNVVDYIYDHNDINPSFAGTIRCDVYNNSSLGQEVCGAFYQ